MSDLTAGSRVFQPGDIVFTRGTGRLSRLIRRMTRSLGESRTKVNHVAIVVEPGTAQTAKIVEALNKVKLNLLWRYANGKDHIAVFRPKNLTEEELAKIIRKAHSYVGRTYGYLKLLTHGLDWLLQGVFVFRRLTQDDRYPICSWAVAHAYAAADKSFGVDPGAASPDDMWDFCVREYSKYDLIYPLGLLK